MSLRAYLILLAAVLLAIAADSVLNQGAASLFLLRKLADFVEYLSFWR
jgi:hypothetical protein